MTLIERLSAAAEGTRELDEDIAAFVAGATIERQENGRLAAHRGGFWVSIEPVRPFSTSIDSALTLVPEGCFGKLHFGGPKGRTRDYCHATIEIADDDSAANGNEFEAQNAATPALAMCIAALRAREAA